MDTVLKPDGRGAAAKSFPDFISDSIKKENGQELFNSFKNILNEKDADALCKWFETSGYAVSRDDCKKIIDNKDDFIAADVNCDVGY